MALSDADIDLIGEARVARLGTIGPGGRPHLVPVCFAFADGHFFVPIDEKPKRGGVLARVRNIERDPRATLLIDRYDEDWTRLAWLRFDCEAQVHTRGGELPEGLAALRNRYPQYREMALEERPLIELTLLRHSGWRWSTGTARRPGTLAGYEAGERKMPQ